MKLLIIRHGDPDYEHDDLTEKGVSEATALSEWIEKQGVTAAYVSPLGRAKRTAEIGLSETHIKPEEFGFLREFDGSVKNYDGTLKNPCWDLLPAYYASRPELKTDAWLKSELFAGTDTEKKYNAVCDGVDLILQKHGYKPVNGYLEVENGNKGVVAIFCHFGVECVILSHLTGVSPYIYWQNFCALPTAVTTLVTEERREGVASLRCLSFGSTEHLYKDGQEPSFAARFRENCFDDTRA